MGGALQNLPTATCLGLTAKARVELRQRIELPTTKLIGARGTGREMDPNRQEQEQQDSARA